MFFGLVVFLFAMFEGECMCSKFEVNLNLRASLDVNKYVAQYRAYDNKQNLGRGYSDSANSSKLAWGESKFLMNYVMLYRVTGDSYYMDKITRHFDRMIYNMNPDNKHDPPVTFSPEDVRTMVDAMIQKYSDTSCLSTEISTSATDGHPIWHTEYPGWHTDRYSVASVKVADSNSKTAKLVPAEKRVSNIEKAHQVTGHKYLIRFNDSTHYTMRDLTESKVIAESAKLKENITEISGITLKVEASPETGDSFTVKTIGVKPLQYLVHDGMVLYPIAQFIELVMNNSELQKQFGRKAEIYVRLIEKIFVPKWERYWTELDSNTGAYKFTESPAERYPNRVLPHNQYNAMCRAYLVLQDKDGTDNPAFREKARKMVRYFKNNLKSTGNAWTWNYWDWDDGHSGPEDSSHASINVSTAIEAFHRGIEFDQDDMVRFAHTLLDQMWNGSLEEINIGDRVNTDKGDRYFHLRHWVELCEFDPKVWEVCLVWFKQKGEPVRHIPSMLYAQKLFETTWTE